VGGGEECGGVVVVGHGTVTERDSLGTVWRDYHLRDGDWLRKAAAGSRAKERALSVGGDGRITERALDPGDEARPRSRGADC
jgi:hypothetical protein